MKKVNIDTLETHLYGQREDNYPIYNLNTYFYIKYYSIIAT